MKIYAGYDEAGNILALAIPSDDMKEGELSLFPQPGQHASEFEVAHVGETQRHEFLNDLFQNYRVERLVSSGESHLKKRDRSRSGSS